MGQDPQELRYDIERRRHEVGETLDAIGDHVSPGRMIERRKNRISEGVRSIGERVMGSASDSSQSVSAAVGSVADTMSPDAIRQQTQGSPLGAGLVSFGIGFLIAVAIPPSRAEEKAAAKLQEHAEPLTDELTDAAKQVGDSVKEQVTEAGKAVASSASDAAQQVKDSAKSAVSETKDQATDAARATQD